MVKKLKIPSEIVYFISIILLSLSVAMLAVTDYGVSMIVAPAFILSEKISWLSFGQSEYIIQGLLFVIFCILMKKVKIHFFFAFLNTIIYGAVLDLWRMLPIFNTAVTTPDSLPTVTRVSFFIIGMTLTSFSVALSFRAYLHPQVYDFFVKGVTERYKIDKAKFKTAFDITFLITGTVFSLILFKGFVGIKLGTLIMAVFNGSLIGFFSKLFDKYLDSTPICKKLAKYFEI